MNLGQSPDEGLNALGRPDRLYRRLAPSGEVEAWGYMPYWPGFAIPAQVIGGGGTATCEALLEPNRDDEDFRVFFKGGRVVAVESRRN